MGVKKYRKKPVVIEAMYVEDDLKCLYEIAKWISGSGGSLTDPLSTLDCAFKIYTLEGLMNVNVGDFVIKGVAGEFYACKPDIFDKTYEEL